MKQIIADKNLVFLGDDLSYEVDCSDLLATGVVFVGMRDSEKWAELEPFTGRVTDYDFTTADRIIEEAEALDIAAQQLPTLSSDELREQAINAIDTAAALIDGLAAAALSRINAGYSAAIAQILAEYPDAETLSFDKQEAQAREWHAWHDPAGNNGQGDEPATPYLDAMLAERPIGKAELVERIIAKADAFTLAHGQATGRRQRLEDEIKAAQADEDRAALKAIGWSD